MAHLIRCKHVLDSEYEQNCFEMASEYFGIHNPVLVKIDLKTVRFTIPHFSLLCN